MSAALLLSLFLSEWAFAPCPAGTLLRVERDTQGAPQALLCVRDGVPDGPALTIRGGTAFGRGRFEAGLRAGLWRFSSAGTPLGEGHYQDGQPVGVWSWWPESRVRFRAEYDAQGQQTLWAQQVEDAGPGRWTLRGAGQEDGRVHGRLHIEDRQGRSRIEVEVEAPADLSVWSPTTPPMASWYLHSAQPEAESPDLLILPPGWHGRGAWRQLDERGGLRAEGTLEGGWNAGTVRFYWPDGCPRREVVFGHPGRRDGVERTWHASSPPAAPGRVDATPPASSPPARCADTVPASVEPRIDDVPHGWWRRWHPDGRPAEEQRYQQGRQVGRARGWYPDGRLAWEQHRLTGEEPAPPAATHPLLTGLEPPATHPGQAHGRWRCWYPDGRPLRDASYAAGQLVGERWWDEQGQELEPEQVPPQVRRRCRTP